VTQYVGRGFSPAESSRIAAVQTPVIPIVTQWMAETPGTISLGQGMVAYGPPDAALEAARHFPQHEGEHRYGRVEGLRELSDMFEAKLAAENNIRVRPHSRVVITAGSNLGFMNAVLAIADPGDEFIFPLPYYFNHCMAVTMANCKTVGVKTRPDYQLDLDAIAGAITPRTRAVVTCSPNNPTGAVYSEASLRAVNALCRERGVFHIHDEAYEYFTYDNAVNFSAGSIDGAAGHTISLYSLSKGYGMASWRIGFMVIPEALWPAVNKIQDTLLICTPQISQRVAVAAMQIGSSYPRAHAAEIGTLRARVHAALTDPSVPCETADVHGAFYHFVRVRTSMDSMTLAERLIREHHVAVIPGEAFGVSDVCAMRVSFGALDRATVDEGLGRLTSGLKALCR
jgi:aspartate/methionine/tyrosine aminotransferase